MTGTGYFGTCDTCGGVVDADNAPNPETDADMTREEMDEGCGYDLDLDGFTICCNDTWTAN